MCRPVEAFAQAGAVIHVKQAGHGDGILRHPVCRKGAESTKGGTAHSFTPARRRILGGSFDCDARGDLYPVVVRNLPALHA